MTDKLCRVFMTLCAMAAPCSPMHARSARNFPGASYAMETRQVKTSELGNVLGQRRKPKKLRSGSCPILPPPYSSIPIQNPNAQEVAFYVNPATGQPTPTNNSSLSAPQTITVTNIVTTAAPGDAPNTPFNSSMCAGLGQVLFVGSYQFISYDRNLVQDNVVNTNMWAFTNIDGDFSFYDWVEEIEMRYDKFENRFFFAQDAFSQLDSQANDGVMFGLSDSGIITEDTSWTIITIPNGNLIPDAQGCPGDVTADSSTDYDYCRASVDQKAYYFAFDIYDNNINISSSGFVIQKDSLINGGPVVVTAFRDPVGYPGDQTPYRLATTLIPAMNLDNAPVFGYFICTDPNYFGRLNLFRVTNQSSNNPSISAAIPIDVPTTYSLGAPNTLAPFKGNQYGSLGAIYPIDDRLKMAHIRNHQLFTCHTILTDSAGIGGVINDRIAIRWYQLDLTGDPTGQGLGTETETTVPALVQAGTLFDPNPNVNEAIFYYQPAIMTNKNGDMTVNGMLSGNNQFISAFNTGRKAADPLGVLRIGASPAASVFQQGSGPYTQDFGGASSVVAPFATEIFGQRIADRQYTCFDPVDDVTMWATQQYTQNGLLNCVLARLDS